MAGSTGESRLGGTEPMQRDILFISNNFPPVIGGSSVVYDQICRHAAKQVVALAPFQRHENGERWVGLEAEDRARGYPIHRIPYLRPPKSAKPMGRWGRFVDVLVTDLPIMLSILIVLMILVMRYRVKVVCIGELISNGWMVFPVRYLLGRRVILYTHGEEITQEGGGALVRGRRLFLRHAHAIISVSRFCQGVIASTYRIDPRKIFYVPNGVDLDTFCPGPSARDTLPAVLRDRKIILSVSRLVERKGHEMLIRAMPQVLARIPEAHCLIVGSGPLAAHLRAQVASLGLEAQISFLGSQPLSTLVALYRSADLFVLPCHPLPDGDTEGFGLVFLEANACRLPVVAGAAGGTVEAVIDGETGLIVDGTDLEEIAGAMIRVLADPVLAARLGRTGQRRAGHWTWAQITRDFLQVVAARGPRQLAASYPTPLPPPRPAPAAEAPGLLVTLDVEEEFDWSSITRDGHHVRGLEGLQDFHQDCASLGLSPVYLVTYAIMSDPDYVAFFRQVLAAGTAEVGIHLHAWVTPPYWEFPNDFNSYQANLPEHIELSKLKTLCRTYEECFGQVAKIHRAGRWGGNSRSTALLESLGFEVDLSPSAGFANAYVDFRNLDGTAFWGGQEGTVLVMPATGIRYFPGPNWLSTAASAQLDRCSRRRRAAASAFTKLVRFSADGQTVAFLSGMARSLQARQTETVVYTLHSTSLYTGGNPYARDEVMAMAVLRRNRELLRYCVETLAMRPATCAGLYAEALRVRALA